MKKKKRPMNIDHIDHSIFNYDFGVLSERPCFDNTFVVRVVPPAVYQVIRDIVSNESTMRKIFDILNTSIFGSEIFMEKLKSIRAYDIRALYRVSAIMIHKDQCTKLQYLVDKYQLEVQLYGEPTSMKFRDVEIGKNTKRSLRLWFEIYVSKHEHMIKAVLNVEALGSLLNVLTFVDPERTLSFASDMLMLFSTCGTYIGSVHAIFDMATNAQKMIGIRSSVLRMLSCYKTSNLSKEQCLSNQIGNILFAARCKLAELDGYDRVGIHTPIGGMMKLLKGLPADVKDLFRGKSSFLEHKNLLDGFLKRVHVTIPFFGRNSINRENNMYIMKSTIEESIPENKKTTGKKTSKKRKSKKNTTCCSKGKSSSKKKKQ
jgi:hypothetical protein